MDSATLDVVYVARSPWEFGWDAVVGLATLLLALVTVAAVVVPIVIEYRRRRDHAEEWKRQAGYLAIDSNVTFGASGAPVLDSRGLVEGAISRRATISRVLAVGAVERQQFVDERPVGEAHAIV